MWLLFTASELHTSDPIASPTVVSPSSSSDDAPYPLWFQSEASSVAFHADSDHHRRLAALYTTFFVQSLIHCILAPVIAVVSYVTLLPMSLRNKDVNTEPVKGRLDLYKAVWAFSSCVLGGALFLVTSVFGLYVGIMWIQGGEAKIEAQAVRIAHMAALIATFDFFPALFVVVVVYILIPYATFIGHRAVRSCSGFNEAGKAGSTALQWFIGALTPLWPLSHFLLAMGVCTHARDLASKAHEVDGRDHLEVIMLTMIVFAASIMQLLQCVVLGGHTWSGFQWDSRNVGLVVMRIVGTVACVGAAVVAVSATGWHFVANEQDYVAPWLKYSIIPGIVALLAGGPFAAVVNAVRFSRAGEELCTGPDLLAAFSQPLTTLALLSVSIGCTVRLSYMSAGDWARVFW